MPSSSCKEFVADVLLLQVFCLELSKHVRTKVIKTAANVGMWEALLKSVNCFLFEIYCQGVWVKIRLQHKKLPEELFVCFFLLVRQQSISVLQNRNGI